MTLSEFSQKGFELLESNDPELFGLLNSENQRQNDVLAMIAASSVADPSVLACEGTATVNVTTEGYPGARFHAGCQYVDEIELLAIDRAKKAFNAQYVNVQPHSGSSANGVILFSLLKPGDTILGLDLDAGGHLTHGSKASVSGRYFNAIGYGLDENGYIDYESVHELALKHKPSLIICGASAYPREIDFKRFREIADEVGAYLLADISHIAGLVVGGVHNSPVDHAHFTTTSTYKQLYGPRGGLIIMGRDFDKVGPDGKTPLSSVIQRGVFPYFQGTPILSAIAAKARALDMVQKPGFAEMMSTIVKDARALSDYFIKKGYRVLTGGTDNHIVLIDILEAKGITGVVAERALEECNIIINKNRIAGDKKSAFVTSGIRLGTNSLALRGLNADQMEECGELIDRVLSSINIVSDKEYKLDQSVISEVKNKVKSICDHHPIPNYVS